MMLIKIDLSKRINKPLVRLDAEGLFRVIFLLILGQYIACDPRGRAFMIAAIEKQKFVYVLERH